MYPFPLDTSASYSAATPIYYQSMLKSFSAPAFTASPTIMTSPFLMDNLLNTKFEHSQQNGVSPGSENMGTRKLLDRDPRGLLTCPIPPKNPPGSSYYNGNTSPGTINDIFASKQHQQNQLESTNGIVTSKLLSPHHQEALGPTATASLTLGITASYSIVAQDTHGLPAALPATRHQPAIVSCSCGGADSCCATKRELGHSLAYYHGQPSRCANSGCCCYDTRGDRTLKASLKQEPTSSQAKPILKFSVSAILGADSVKPPPCSGKCEVSHEVLGSELLLLPANVCFYPKIIPIFYFANIEQPDFLVLPNKRATFYFTVASDPPQRYGNTAMLYKGF